MMKKIYFLLLAAVCCQLSISQTALRIATEATPEHLYLVGGPVNTHNPNWLVEDAVELAVDAGNPAIFHYKGYLSYNILGDEPGSFKLLLGRDWNPAYHPAGNSDAALSQALKTPVAMRLNGDDTKWTLPSDGSGNGYYEISIHTADLTLCVDSFRYAEEVYPEKIYVTGAALPCGWTELAPEVMTPVEGQYGAFSWTGNVSAGEFKFLRARGNPGIWAHCYVAGTEAETIVYGQPHAVLYEEDYINKGGNDYKFVMPTAAGEVTITLDLKTMTLTVTQKTVEPEGTAIGSFEELNTLMRADLTGSYYLTANIEIPTGTEWVPIGATSATDANPQHFKGTFDGKGYRISNLTIATTGSFKGLFGRLNHAVVRDLDLVNVNIANAMAPTGGVAGAMFGETLIERVSVGGTISGGTEIGGIAGRVATDETFTGYNLIRDCYVTANVRATRLSTDMNTPSVAGGIVAFSRGDIGGNYGKIDVRRVYVSGNIASDQMTHVSGNAAGIVTFYDSHNFVKMDEVIVLSENITAATPNLFFSRRGPTYDQFELFGKVYARDDIALTYLVETDKGRGGEIAGGVIQYNPVATYRTLAFYTDNLTWDFDDTWTITEGRFPILKRENNPTALRPTAATDSYRALAVAGGVEVYAPESFSVRIYDIAGRLAGEKQAARYQAFIPLRAGIYVVKIEGSEGQRSFKVPVRQ
jgi:hypothetical protein